MEFTWFVVLVSVVALLLIVVKFMTLCKKCDNQTVVLLKGLANKVQIVHTCIHILESFPIHKRSQSMLLSLER